ncbi:MAG: restriction endonuclease subunit S [Planctomycetota bacterium]
MSGKLQPYPAYKASGTAWCGQVPTHWSCLPHRALFTEVKDQGHPDEAMLSVTISQGVIRQADLLADSSKKDSSNLDKAKYKLVEPGDIAYNKMRAWQGAVGVSRYRGIVSPAYIVVRPRSNANPEYVHFLLRTPGFAKEAERWSYGITSDMWSLRPEHFKMIYTCLPSREEQDAIVRYLRVVDTKVNCFIRNRRRLIEVLNEQKQAIINRAVTRGLHSDVSLKPSGIDWLGDVPKHWDVAPLRWYVRIGSGEFLSGDLIRSEISCTHPHPVVGGNGVMGYTSAWNTDGTSLVIGRVGALCGNVHIIEGQSWITDNALRLARVRRFRLDYLALQLAAMNLNRLANASAQPLITGAMVKSQAAVLPPESEQVKIVEFVREATVALQTERNRAGREVALIREYRTRLVADVVTGKLDVRHLAPATLDEMPIAQHDDVDDGVNDMPEAEGPDLVEETIDGET